MAPPHSTLLIGAEERLKETGNTWTSKVLLAILWANFVFLWIRVYWITTRVDVADSVSYLGGLISVYGFLVAAWIYHNVRIHRLKGPRKAARAMEVERARDVLKRRISPHVDLSAEQEIAVEIVGGTKFFIHHSARPETPEQPAEPEVLVYR
ncbi:MAG TPA: hypothetical protein VFY29_01975 [Terriglobia bacterium]|nr:hypothetical protein [Terriglobia bacterium]